MKTNDDANVQLAYGKVFSVLSILFFPQRVCLRCACSKPSVELCLEDSQHLCQCVSTV